jgi:hypothetical protein
LVGEEIRCTSTGNSGAKDNWQSDRRLLVAVAAVAAEKASAC